MTAMTGGKARAPRVRERPTQITRQELEAVRAALAEIDDLASFLLDAEMSALEELESNDDVEAAVGYSAEDAEDAFSAEGVLVADLPLYTAGVHGLIQVAFAYAGLVVHVPASDAEDDAFLPRDAATRSSDLLTLLVAFDALRAAGFEAEPCFGITSSDAWSTLPRDAPAILWTQQDHDAFDADGMMTDRFSLEWRGDRGRLADLLTGSIEGSGLQVEVPDSDRDLFIVYRAGVSRSLHRHEAIEA